MVFKKPTRKIIRRITVILLFIIGLIIFLFVREMDIQDYCWEKARKITGDKANTLVESNEEEKTIYGLGQTTLWFREELKCEKGLK